MFVEFYIDRFLIEQILTGYLILNVTSRAAKLSVKRWKIMMVSVLHGSLSLFLVLQGWGNWRLAGLFLSAWILYGKYGKKVLWSQILRETIITIYFGGTIQAIYILFSIPLIPDIILSAFLVQRVEKWIHQENSRRYRAQILLEWKGQKVQVSALIDSGNQLTEPLTRRPVSILNEENALQLLGAGWQEYRGFYLIPYHSLGKKQGWLQGVTIDRMYVLENGDRREEPVFCIQRPVIAIYKGQVSANGEYQMILHPMHTALRAWKQEGSISWL